MTTNLLDPLILDTIMYQPVKQGGNILQAFQGFSLTKFVLNVVIPALIFLGMAFFVKLKWDQKQKKLNLGI